MLVIKTDIELDLPHTNRIDLAHPKVWLLDHKRILDVPVGRHPYTLRNQK